MYLTDYVKSTLSRVVLGKDIPSFPYNIGERVDSFNSTIWSLHKGTKREDDSPVSILCFDCVRQRDKLPIARNAFKKFRTIRHPDLIKYIDGIETESNIYIVTDAVTPLEDHLAKNLDPNLIRWGLYKVANVLKFLTMDASFIHGNIRTSSIFVTKSGEWKVGGFELVTSLKEDQPAILSFSGLVPDSNRYAPPEVRKKSWQVVKDNDLWATDTWHFACLIYEVYNGVFSSPEQLATPGNVPSEMAPYYKNLLRPDPKMRPSVSDFLDKGLQTKGFFQTDLIQVVLFLENFSVKEPLAKDTFLRKLDMQVERLPKEFCRYKVLPELIHALEYGSGGARVLAPIIKMAKELDEQEYDQMVGSVIVKMFASTDRAIRLSLLENLAGFIERIHKKIVNDKIFPAMAMGFTDTAPIIREWTVKSVLLVIGKLSDKTINYELLRYLGKLQTDEEPGIRTNAVICLGKITKHLNEGTKAKILVPAFTRSLRDPFAHARVASLMALNATAEAYSKEDIANRIIPCISLTLIDTEKIVRTQAFRTLETFTRRAEKLVEGMSDSAIPPEQNAGRASPARPSTPSTPSAASTSSAETWAGWAVSSITKKLVTGDMQSHSGTLPGTPTPSAGTGSVPSRSGASTPSAGINGSSNGMALGSGGANGLHIGGSSSRVNGGSGAGGAGSGANKYSAALAAIEQDDSMISEDAGSGWGNDDQDLFADMGNDFEPLESFEPSTPSPASSATMKPHSTGSLGAGSRTSSTAASRPLSMSSRPAGNAMSLGGGATKTATSSSRLAAEMLDDVDAWGDDFSQALGGGGNLHTPTSRPLSKTTSGSGLSSSLRPAGSPTTTTSSTPSTNSASALARKEERAAELAKKREERRQRMAEAKEKKAAAQSTSTLGAKKV